jgi:proteic killer suppression protein
MIQSFADKDLAGIWEGYFSKQYPRDLQRIIKRKLVQIHAAVDLRELRVPPGNRLEPLKGNREGQWSIRVNDQWRLCFVWHETNAYEVELVDYH